MLKTTICFLVSIWLIYAERTDATAKTFALRRQSSVADSTNEFAFDLHKTFPTDDNIVFSPWGIAFSLAMIAMGAEGDTLSEMRQAMFLTQISPDNVHYGFKQLREHLVRYDHEYEMNMFSTILVQEKNNISPVYKLKLQRYYDADIHDVDFSHLGTLVTEWINVWTSLKTGGKIKHILTSVPNQNTVMLLLTANYFKGIWNEAFNANETKLSEFHNDDGEIAMVNMMYTSKNMSIYVGNKFALDAVDVPMKGDVSFMFMFPKNPQDLEILQQNFSTEFLADIDNNMSKEPVHLGIPKFHASSRVELQESLEALGVVKLFTPNEANLSGISSNGGLSVQEVIHKASLEIDEDGAVATSVTIISIISRIRVYKMHFDRPFVFLIRDRNSGTILFMGRISKL